MARTSIGMAIGGYNCHGIPANSSLYCSCDIAEIKDLTTESTPPQESISIEQQLRNENAALKKELAEARAYLKIQKYRRREFARMLKIGFYEWDERNNRPISYSPEVAEVLGLDRGMMEKFFHNPDLFKRFLHPDDLQQ